MLGPDVECVKCSLFRTDALDLLESADAFYMGGADEPEAQCFFTTMSQGVCLQDLHSLFATVRSSTLVAAVDPCIPAGTSQCTATSDAWICLVVCGWLFEDVRKSSGSCATCWVMWWVGFFPNGSRRL